MSENKLFPVLSDEAAEEAQLLMDDFKKQLIKIANEVLSKMYCDVAYYIGTDGWTNYRNELMDGFKDYKNNKKTHAMYDFKAIRQRIFEENREEIIDDLNKDLLYKVEELEKQIDNMSQYIDNTLYR
jgi:hypothetical protein